jgi:hypothetical protein
VHTLFGPDAGLSGDLCAGHEEMYTLVWGVMLLRTVTVSHYARMQLHPPEEPDVYGSGPRVSMAICTLGSNGKRIGSCTPASRYVSILRRHSAGVPEAVKYYTTSSSMYAAAASGPPWLQAARTC